MTDGTSIYYPESQDEKDYIYNNWYTVPVVAAMFGYTPQTIYQQIRRGALPAAVVLDDSRAKRPPIKSYRVDPEHIAALLEAQERMKDWYTINEAAQKLGISQMWIYQLLQSGRLHGEKINDTRWMVNNEQVDRAAAAKRQYEISATEAAMKTLDQD